MDSYFKFKMFTEFTLPFIVCAITFVIISMMIIIKGIKEQRIHIFFKKNGYERELFGVPSFGDGAFYGWVRKSDNKRVDDRDIRGWTLKQIKEKYK